MPQPICHDSSTVSLKTEYVATMRAVARISSTKKAAMDAVRFKGVFSREGPHRSKEGPHRVRSVPSNRRSIEAIEGGLESGAELDQFRHARQSCGGVHISDSAAA